MKLISLSFRKRSNNKRVPPKSIEVLPVEIVTFLTAWLQVVGVFEFWVCAYSRDWLARTEQGFSA